VNLRERLLHNDSMAVLVLLLVSILINSEDASARGFDLGLSFDVAAPQDEFRNTVDRNGYGFSIEGLYKPGDMPVKFGLDFGFSQYGRETRKEPFSLTIPDVMVDVKTTNNILLTHFLVRLQHDYGRIKPYFDGIVGLHYLYTETSIDNEDDWDDEPIASTKNFDDLTLSRGVGAGFMISLVSFDKHDKAINSFMKATGGMQKAACELLLDFKIRYLYGGEAEYLKEGSITRENGDVIYDVKRSDTDLLLFQLGVIFRF